MRTIASGNSTYLRTDISITWTRFITEEIAKSNYEELVGEYKDKYSFQQSIGSSIGEWDSDSKKTEISLVYGDVSRKIIFIREEECILFLEMEGIGKNVERLAEEFLEGLE